LSAVEFAKRLYHSERAGLIRVTFDPENDMEPRAELTDLGRKRLQSDF
jgi:DNA-binding MarR family transcriptional regulator